jgi:outer membrane lipoprotein-sorting protein
MLMRVRCNLNFVRLKFQKRSALKFASRSESQISEAQRTDICWTNYPIVNKPLGTIPQSGGYKTPKLALGFIPVAFFCMIGIFLVLSPLNYAGANDFEQLRKESAKIKTIQAHFVQKKSMKILSRPLISEGRFYYVAPDSFRWEYFKPLRSIVLAYKNNTKRFIASGGKMVEDKTGGAQALNIVLGEVAGWMSGRFDQNPSFAAIIHEESNTRITLTPVEKNMTGMIEKIEITLSKKSTTVQSVKIIESANNFTQINFDNVEINKAINPSVFQDVQ